MMVVAGFGMEIINIEDMGLLESILGGDYLILKNKIWRHVV
jgi:hypothetical protein